MKIWIERCLDYKDDCFIHTVEPKTYNHKGEFWPNDPEWIVCQLVSNVEQLYGITLAEFPQLTEVKVSGEVLHYWMPGEEA